MKPFIRFLSRGPKETSRSARTGAKLVVLLTATLTILLATSASALAYPLIVDYSPKNATDVPTDDATFKLYFLPMSGHPSSDMIDYSTLAAGIHIRPANSPGGSSVPCEIATAQWQGSGTVVVFSPMQPLSPGTTYKIGIAATRIKNTSGESAQIYDQIASGLGNWTFTTASEAPPSTEASPTTEVSPSSGTSPTTKATSRTKAQANTPTLSTSYVKALGQFAKAKPSRSVTLTMMEKSSSVFRTNLTSLLLALGNA